MLPATDSFSKLCSNTIQCHVNPHSCTYISERASKSATPSERSAMVSGGFPESVGKVPTNSTIALWRASLSVSSELIVVM